jgi:exosome complex component RRP40
MSPFSVIFIPAIPAHPPLTLSQNFIVDINGPFSALLPQLSFEGATKRNRPNLKPGDVVYARVAAASRDMEPVLTCVDAAGKWGVVGVVLPGVPTWDGAS